MGERAMAFRRIDAMLVGLAAIIAVPSALLVAHFATMPVQPKHPAMARVFAISANEGKFHANLDYIVVRNATGTGQFRMLDDEVRCRVGDQVPVEQQGIVLTRTGRTCR